MERTREEREGEREERRFRRLLLGSLLSPLLSPLRPAACSSARHACPPRLASGRRCRCHRECQYGINGGSESASVAIDRQIASVATAAATDSKVSISMCSFLQSDCSIRALTGAGVMSALFALLVAQEIIAQSPVQAARLQNKSPGNSNLLLLPSKTTETG